MNDTAHILVVDDQNDICEVVQDYLVGEGYRVSTANDGTAMRRIIAQTRKELTQIVRDWLALTLALLLPLALLLLLGSAISLSVTGTVITSCASAYGFARFNWRGRNFFFMVLLSTLVLPEEVVLIPKFLMFNNVPPGA